MYRQFENDERCDILYKYPSGHILCAITTDDSRHVRLYDRWLLLAHLMLSSINVRELLSKKIVSSTLHNDPFNFYVVGGTRDIQYKPSIEVTYLGGSIGTMYRDMSIFATATKMSLDEVPEYDAVTQDHRLYVVPKHLIDFVKLRSRQYQQLATFCIATLMTRTTLPLEVVRDIVEIYCKCAHKCYSEYCVSAT